MARITRTVRLDSDQKPFVKINGLSLYPLGKSELQDGDEVVFSGKNGKFIAQDRTPWGPLGSKVAVDLFLPIEKKVELDKTLDIIKIIVMRYELENYPDMAPTEFNVGREYIEDKDMESGYRIAITDTYLAGNLVFDYNVSGNVIKYRVIEKPANYTWSY